MRVTEDGNPSHCLQPQQASRLLSGSTVLWLFGFDGCIHANPSSWAPYTPQQVPPSLSLTSIPCPSFSACCFRMWLSISTRRGFNLSKHNHLNFNTGKAMLSVIACKWGIVPLCMDTMVASFLWNWLLLGQGSRTWDRFYGWACYCM